MPSRIPKTELQPELIRLGDNLRRERMRIGMTQEVAAERAGLALRTLQKIEAGEINILVTTARRLKVALGCSWGRLMDG